MASPCMLMRGAARRLLCARTVSTRSPVLFAQVAVNMAVKTNVALAKRSQTTRQPLPCRIMIWELSVQACGEGPIQCDEGILSSLWCKEECGKCWACRAAVEKTG
eukprot:1161297-Pelagomonas_calceolata.AAC.7